MKPTQNADSITLLMTVELAQVSGTQLVFSRDGHRWAAADGLSLHVGSDGALMKTVYPTAAAPVGPLWFSADGHRLHWGAAAVPLDDAGMPGDISAPRENLYAALVAAFPADSGVEVVSSASTEDGVAVAAGRSRPAPGRDARNRPSIGRVVLLNAGGPAQVLWQGPGLETPTVIAIAGDFVAAGGSRLLLAERKTGRVIVDDANPHPRGSVTAISFMGDTTPSRLWTASADGTLCQWDLPSGKRHPPVVVSQEPLRALAIAARQDYLAVTGWDDTLRVYRLSDLARGPVAALALGAHGDALAFSPDGARLLLSTGGARGVLRFVSVQGNTDESKR